MSLSSPSFTFWQQLTLVVIRFAIGWHLFLQGLAKFWDVHWTARGYLLGARGPLAPLFHTLGENATLLRISDLATQWGLLLSGLLLMVGLLTRSAATAGFLLLMMFYLAAPPLTHHGFITPSVEGTELYVNKTLIQALALLLVVAFPTGRMAGLDLLWRRKRDADQRREEDSTKR